jgi:hypothetical protein
LNDVDPILLSCHQSDPATGQADWTTFNALTNAMGTKPVTFAGNRSITILPRESRWSDTVALNFVNDPAALQGRKLAVSFTVVGESGPKIERTEHLRTTDLRLVCSCIRGLR